MKALFTTVYNVYDNKQDFCKLSIAEIIILQHICKTNILINDKIDKAVAFCYNYTKI